jgi:hypothetical protein
MRRVSNHALSLTESGPFLGAVVLGRLLLKTLAVTFLGSAVLDRRVPKTVVHNTATGTVLFHCRMLLLAEGTMASRPI